MSEYRCENCKHWGGTDSSYSAPCKSGHFPANVPFDMTCDKHSSKAQPTPYPQDQSNARANIVQMWQGKP